LRHLRLSPGDLAEDLFADAAYRGHLAAVLARRAVTLADGSGVLVLSHGAQIADLSPIDHGAGNSHSGRGDLATDARWNMLSKPRFPFTQTDRAGPAPSWSD